MWFTLRMVNSPAVKPFSRVSISSMDRLALREPGPSHLVLARKLMDDPRYVRIRPLRGNAGAVSFIEPARLTVWS